MTRSQQLERLEALADHTVHTHASVVFLRAGHAYKVKKPVDFGFLDYSTVERRRHFCEEEVRLNRRWCDGIYLGVVPLTEVLAAPGPDGSETAQTEPVESESVESEPVEWAVQMRRYDEADTLRAIVEAGAATESLLAEVGRALAARHAACPRTEAARAWASWDHLRDNALDNFTATRGHATIPSELHEALQRATEAELDRVRPVVDRRSPRAAEIHGDLRLQHTLVRTVDGDRRIDFVDCIEFNEPFRMGDAVSDLGFLAMDLAVRGERGLAMALVDAWIEASGDAEARELLVHETAYRSVVRAKVAELEAAADEVPAEQRHRATARARRHWLHAAEILLPPGRRPALLGLGGLPGTGKSTLARALSTAHGFTWIRADVVRKELAGLSPGTDASADFEQGLYSPEHTEQTYATCLQRAAHVVADGGRAVIDASFGAARHREAVHTLAVQLGLRPEVWLCEVSEAEALRRLATRPAGPSDATEAIYRRAAARFADDDTSTRLSTAGSVDATLARLHEQLVAVGWAS